MSFSKMMDDHVEIKEAAIASLQSWDSFVLALGHHAAASSSSAAFDCRAIADHTVSKFRRLNSALGPTGHALFRRGPVLPAPADSSSSRPPPPPVPLFGFTEPTPAAAAKITVKSHFSDEGLCISPPISGNYSVRSSVTADHALFRRGPAAASPMGPPPPRVPAADAKITGKAHVSDEAFSISGNSSFQSSITGDGRARLPYSHKKNCTSGRCHCAKPREARVTARVRVPAMSSGNVHMDGHSWRKYGQKTIKHVLYPRAYYQCSRGKSGGCPARKIVDRDRRDPSMMIVTYVDHHRHVQKMSSDGGAKAALVLGS